MKKTSFIFLLLIVILACGKEKKKDKADYRDAFVGKYIGEHCVYYIPFPPGCQDNYEVIINKEYGEDKLGVSIANEYTVFTVNADGSFEQSILKEPNYTVFISGQFFEDSVDFAYYALDEHYFNGIKE